MMARFLWLLLFLIPFAKGVAAGLDELEAEWQKGTERIQQDTDTKLAKRHESYESALKELAKRSQDEGNLDATLAIKKEQGRYEAARVVGPDDVVEAPARLKQIQESWIQLEARELIDQARQVIQLGERYSQALNQLQISLTRDGKLDEAVKVREVREALVDRPEMSEARFVLAEMSRPVNSVTRKTRPVQAAGPRIVIPPDNTDKSLLFHVPFEAGRQFLAESVSGLFLTGLAIQPASLARRQVAGSFSTANAGAILQDAKLTKPFPASRSADPGSFTLAAWINRRTSNKRDPIIAKQSNETRGFVFMIEQNNSLAIEMFADNSNDKATRFQAPQAIEPDRWYHVAVTYQAQPEKGGILCLFVDGVQRGRLDSAIGPLHRNGEDVSIGRYTWNNSYSVSFDGLLDDIRVYEGAKPANEIKALFLENPH